MKLQATRLRLDEMKSNVSPTEELLVLSRSFPRCCRKSSFGPQVRSNLRSAPAIGFGTSLREASQKQYISPAHARSTSGNNSPGAVYKTYSSIGFQTVSEKGSSPAYGFGNSPRDIRERASTAPGPGNYNRGTCLGRQSDSTRATSARAVFGSSTRDDTQKLFMDEELAKTYYGLESPPPNSYNIPATIGRQVISSRKSAPGWGTGTAQRFQKVDSKAALFEGGKSYRVPTACGLQIQSSKRSAPQFSFGDTTREKLEKVLISAEHAKQSCGGCSPGPGVGQCPSGIGNQTLSYKRSAPGWGFGSSKRDGDNYDDLPGPGAYCV